MKYRYLMVGVGAVGGLSLASCELLENSEQYFAPVAAEVVLVDVPTDGLQAYGIDAPAATTMMVAIGRLTEPSDPGSSPFSGEGVSDAKVTVTTSAGAFDLVADGSTPGLYILSSIEAPEFKYVVGGEYTVNLSFSGQDYWMKFNAVDSVTLEEPEEMGLYHEPGTDLTLSWAEPADNVVVTMFDSSGNEAYDNLPRDLNGLFAFLTEDATTEHVIGGDRFQSEEAYGIVLAGLERAVVDEAHVSTNLNHLVTNIVSGKGVMTAVYTEEIPDIEDLTE